MGAESSIIKTFVSCLQHCEYYLHLDNDFVEKIPHIHNTQEGGDNSPWFLWDQPVEELVSMSVRKLQRNHSSAERKNCKAREHRTSLHTCKKIHTYCTNMAQPKTLAAGAATNGDPVANAPEGKTNKKKHTDTKSASQNSDSIKKHANLAVARKDVKKKKARRAKKGPIAMDTTGSNKDKKVAIYKLDKAKLIEHGVNYISPKTKQRILAKIEFM
eukprot:11610220-Ditylum_brightwellii.AAC.1